MSSYTDRQTETLQLGRPIEIYLQCTNVQRCYIIETDYAHTLIGRPRHRRIHACVQIAMLIKTCMQIIHANALTD